MFDNIRVVLVRPKYGGNIGAVCRAMMNGGLTDLALVAPDPQADWEDARRRAHSAVDVLDRACRVDTLQDALGDCAAAAGTTARPGLYRAHATTPREFAPRALECARANRVALVFGPEDKGLNNRELALCTDLLRIPSSGLYPSLNLSHAVYVCAYEIFMASGSFEPEGEPTGDAAIEQRERMYALWREVMAETGFAEPEKIDHMMMGLRRIFSRGRLSDNDVRILLGLARQTLWACRRRDGKNGA
ncbi:RNA methyltransferase [Kiritimatiella glycovorans]|uniref:RNA methyltransferase n=1 Tax=Kiritimatiella glycovorans TaxID=1307763 RepID=UPI001364D5D5|nr:RNA methyltransferase [Kiritimatiella glycovorans]